MVDFVKKNWQFRDIISENELNRMEAGIEEGIEKAEQAEQTATQTANELAAHEAENASGAHKAKNIAVEDVNNRFTATDVEGVLNELFTFANDGKTSIAAVIGSPATSGDTFSQLATHIQNSKNTLATNLTNKGQSSSGTETLANLVAKVANISTGKKWASGTATNTSGSTFTRADGSTLTGRGLLSVTGLDFVPSSVLIWAANQSFFTVLFPSTLYESTYPYGRIIVGSYSSGTTTSTPIDNVRLEGNANVFNGGFNLPVTVTTAILWNWFAFE